MPEIDLSRPQRVYRHSACGTDSTLPEPVFEVFLSDPKQVAQLECEHCKARFPLAAFAWQHPMTARAFGQLP